MEQFIVPSPSGFGGYTELAAQGSGAHRRFRKHLLNLGQLTHPKTGESITLDEGWFHRMRDNFRSGVVDMPSVPLADDRNRHSEDPLRNTGVVVDLELNGTKVYDIIEVRDPAVAEKIANGTILGASAMLHLDYEPQHGRKVGPALLHHCLTNRPYVTGLEPYEEVIAATADWDQEYVVLAQDHEEDAVPLSKEELIAGLKEHGIDVEALQEAATAKTDTAALTSAIVDALKGSGTLELAGGQEGLTTNDVVGAIVELSQQNKAAADRVSKLEREAAEREVGALVSSGRVMPKQRARFVELALTNRAMFEDLVPEEPVIKLNNTTGVSGDEGQGKQEQDIDAEIVRLTEQHSQFFSSDGNKAK